MPKTNQGKIYKLVSSHTNDIYIGSTRLKLSERFSCHKSSFARYNKKKSRMYNTSYKVQKFPDCKIVLLESHKNISVKKLRQRERHFIESSNNSVNASLPGRTNKEYYRDNRDTILAKKNEKYECQCGGRYTRVNRATHLKSLKHRKYSK